MSGSNLLFILTGSIAAYKACDAISKLVQNGHRVRTVATPSALRFVGAATLEGLTRSPVLSDLFEAGRALDHIDLTRWADAVIVCPASANTLNRFAAGLADDLVGALFLAHDRSKPWLVAPAMNPAMWSHPATQRSVQQLRDWGVHFIDVGRGSTACGEIGDGRLAEPVDIVAAIERTLARPTKKLRVLITSGGTAEPVDGVRVLSNTSTGYTGAQLARHFHLRGHEVQLLRAAQSVSPGLPAIREQIFRSTADLQHLLNKNLGEDTYDAVIHAAAVSDFQVASIEIDQRRADPSKKISSNTPPILHLAPNPKLIDELRRISRNPDITVVAFKLTDHAAPMEIEAAIAKLFAQSPADLVVHNDLSARAEGPDAFPASLYFRNRPASQFCDSRKALAHSLETLLASPTLNTALPCSSASTSATATSTPAFTAAIA